MEELIKHFGEAILGVIGALAVIGLGVYFLYAGKGTGTVFEMLHSLLGQYL